MNLFVFAAIAIVVLFTTVAVASQRKPTTSDEGGVFVNNPSSKIIEFAGAIAFAEGFWDAGGNIKTQNRPARNNNPGDFLGDGDAGSESGYAVYSTLEKGWERLYGQLQMIIDGRSHNYNLDMTISDMAYVYTATQQDAWSENVAKYLGATRDTPLRGLLT